MRAVKILKIVTMANTCEDAQKINLLYISVRNININVRVSVKNCSAVSLKNQVYILPYDPAVALLGIYPM